jgi:hypothetical protein
VQRCVSVISGFNFPEASEKYETHRAALALIIDGQLPGSSPDGSIAQVIWSSNQTIVQGSLKIKGILKLIVIANAVKQSQFWCKDEIASVAPLLRNDSFLSEEERRRCRVTRVA